MGCGERGVGERLRLLRLSPRRHELEQLLRWQSRDDMFDAADDATSSASSSEDRRSGTFGIRF